MKQPSQKEVTKINIISQCKWPYVVSNEWMGERRPKLTDGGTAAAAAVSALLLATASILLSMERFVDVLETRRLSVLSLKAPAVALASSLLTPAAPRFLLLVVFRRRRLTFRRRLTTRFFVVVVALYSVGSRFSVLSAELLPLVAAARGSLLTIAEAKRARAPPTSCVAAKRASRLEAVGSLERRALLARKRLYLRRRFTGFLRFTPLLLLFFRLTAVLSLVCAWRRDADEDDEEEEAGMAMMAARRASSRIRRVHTGQNQSSMGMNSRGGLRHSQW